MTDIKHTPGPWEVKDFHNNNFYQKVGPIICANRVSSADLTLVSLAPEMFELLKNILKWSAHENGYGEYSKNMRCVERLISKTKENN